MKIISLKLKYVSGTQDLLGAGMDTTSKTIKWVMAELFRNPNVYTSW